ncbi:hypothetical protein FRX31_031446 [Thalictrum thalictroides]|uniref:Uncharacterized protein n=1 Tax=Thalictrum thalictroides TaxID=46969 RepID=A0A7J6V3F9_THATH|nr:hypothetical protein FRX31_031446 [Thalictrum thalictroides]
MEEESDIKRFREGGTIRMKDCTTTMSIFQVKRTNKLENFRMKEIDNVMEECNENQVVCTYAQLNFGLVFPLEDDLARLMNEWGLLPIQILIRCYMIYTRAKKLEFCLKRRFGYEKLRRIMRVTLIMEKGKLVVAHDSAHPKYNFHGFPKGLKLWDKKILLVEGDWNEACYEISNEYQCERFVLEKPTKDAQVERNLAFYFDSGKDKCLLDLSYEDKIVELIYNDEMEEEKINANNDTLVPREKRKEIGVERKVAQKRLKRKVVVNDDEQEDEIDIMVLSMIIRKKKIRQGNLCGTHGVMNGRLMIMTNIMWRESQANIFDESCQMRISESESDQVPLGERQQRLLQGKTVRGNNKSSLAGLPGWILRQIDDAQPRQQRCSVIPRQGQESGDVVDIVRGKSYDIGHQRKKTWEKLLPRKLK